MSGPLVMLTMFIALLALCGLLAHRYGRDSRDGFADQAHRAPRQ